MSVSQRRPQANLPGVIMSLGSANRQQKRAVGGKGAAHRSADASSTEVSVNTFTGTLLNPGATPTITRHERTPRPPQPAPDFFGRERELKLIRREIQPEGGVWLYGPGGCGLSTLLRQAAGIAGARLRDGVTYVEGEIEPMHLDDIIQRLFNRFYAVSAPVHVTADMAQQYLGNLQATIVLDHLAIDRAALIDLTDVLVESAVLVAADSAAPDTLLAVQIGSLTRPEAIRLCAAEARIEEAASQVMSKLDHMCAALGDMPLPILLAGRLLQRNAMTLDAIAARLDELVHREVAVGQHQPLAERDTIASADLAQLYDPIELAANLAIAALSPNEQSVLAALTRIGGHDADLAALTATSLLPAEVVEQALDRLIELRLAEYENGRYNVPSVSLLRALDRLLRPGPERSHAAAYFAVAAALRIGDLGWLGRERGNLIAAIETSLAEGLPSQAGAMAQALQPMLVLRGLWGTWGEVVEWAIQAAERRNDDALLAWALHERGTRAGLLGDPQSAGADLTRAYRMRNELSDREGAAATLHNLAYLGLISPHGPSSPGYRWPRWVAASFALVPMLIGLGGLSALIIAADRPPPALGLGFRTLTPTHTPEPTATGTLFPTGTSISTPQSIRMLTAAPTSTPTPTATRTPESQRHALQPLIVAPTSTFLPATSTPEETGAPVEETATSAPEETTELVEETATNTPSEEPTPTEGIVEPSAAPEATPVSLPTEPSATTVVASHEDM
jgi:hypothetical protein